MTGLLTVVGMHLLPPMVRLHVLPVSAVEALSEANLLTLPEHRYISKIQKGLI